ncbi:MAG TPA: SCO family protein [Thermoanaerobaculia bacterium]|nr:SCO family protein [Thermoanaerobaculia bacterium]
MKRLLFALLLIAPLTAAAQAPAAQYFGNLKLVDQNGRRVDLYQDLMKGKTVVINSFFASCTASCAMMSRTFLYLQDKLGDRVGQDVTLVSITVDPEHDTPEKLKSYAQRIGAKQGWYLLTGTRAEVDAALRKLGQYTEVREGHVNIIVAGNDRTGLWKKALGVAKSEDVYKVVASVADDKGEPSAGGD